MRKLLPVQLATSSWSLSCYLLLSTMDYSHRRYPLDFVLNKCLLFNSNDCFKYCADVIKKITCILWTGVYTKASAVFLRPWVQQVIEPVKFLIFMSISFAMTHAGPSTWILPLATRSQVIALEKLCNIRSISAVLFRYCYNGWDCQAPNLCGPCFFSTYVRHTIMVGSPQGYNLGTAQVTIPKHK